MSCFQSITAPWTDSEVYHVKDKTKPCQVLINLWEDPEHPNAPSLCAKPQITDLDMFLKYKKGEEAFEQYNSACSASRDLCARTTCHNQDYLILKKSLKEQAKWLMKWLTTGSTTQRLETWTLAICTTKYWENSGLNLCKDEGCPYETSHNLGFYEVRKASHHQTQLLLLPLDSTTDQSADSTAAGT